MTLLETDATTFAKHDPATGELIDHVSITSAAELARAVDAARAAQPEWEALGADERIARLAPFAQRLEERAEELARCVTREMGKPYPDALREVKGWVAHTPEILDEVRRAVAEENFDSEGVRTRLVRDPHGVVAAITPWNFPVAMPLSILLPALATGNSVVFKPSEHVPLTGALLHELLAAGLPQDVLGLVQGAGAVGAQLVDSAVDMVGFVGSRDTGVRIMAAASAGLKRLVLELGGKDPLVVFADSDLNAAADCAVRHSLRNTGQVCCAVERVYVEESIADEFEQRVIEKAKKWTHGNGFEEGVRMGPLVSTEQRAKVVAQVEQAVAHGARLLLGGETPEGPGAFYPATVLADVSPEHEVHTAETFGPVVCLSTFNGDEDEAVRLANDTPYGLGASIYSGDRERGLRIAKRVRSGQVGVNRYLGGAPGTPWVGARQSGFGFLGGIEGHRQFTVPKSISS